MVDKKTLTEEDIKRLFITQNKDGILLYRWQSDI